MDQDFITAALDYHRSPTRGKISVVPTKGLTNQRDLALAYSPGVAYACEAIVAELFRQREINFQVNERRPLLTGPQRTSLPYS